jgi:hypothetical protein
VLRQHPVRSFETPPYRTALDPFVVILAAVALVAAAAALARRRGASVQRRAHGYASSA